MPPLFPADAADANRRDRAHAWYAAYYEAIYRYTYMKMQNNDEAGIAASDTFVRMMQNADKLAALFRALDQNRLAPKRLALVGKNGAARLALVEAKKLGGDGVTVTYTE